MHAFHPAVISLRGEGASDGRCWMTPQTCLITFSQFSPQKRAPQTSPTYWSTVNMIPTPTPPPPVHHVAPSGAPTTILLSCCVKSRISASTRMWWKMLLSARGTVFWGTTSVRLVRWNCHAPWVLFWNWQGKPLPWLLWKCKWLSRWPQILCDRGYPHTPTLSSAITSYILVSQFNYQCCLERYLDNHPFWEFFIKPNIRALSLVQLALQQHPKLPSEIAPQFGHIYRS